MNYGVIIILSYVFRMDCNAVFQISCEEENYEPFTNQVGGHTVLLRKKCDSSIIKPVNSKELLYLIIILNT